MAKNFVVTARGTRLNMNELKAANPNARPVGVRKGRPDSKSTTQKTVPVRTARINAPTPAPRPSFSQSTQSAVRNVVSVSPAPAKKSTKA